MSHGYANCALATCYRHPDRETGLSCSECGRPICTDCVTFAPVGLRCPDHAGVSRASRRRRAPFARVQRPLARRGIVIRGAIVTRDPRRAERDHLPDHRRPGRRDQRSRRAAVQQVAALRAVRRARRLVASPHRLLPPRRDLAHRREHVRALVARLGRRGSDRVAALLAALHRLGPGGLCRRAALESERAHGRRLRGDLRNARRRAPARVAGDRAARWAASR